MKKYLILLILLLSNFLYAQSIVTNNKFDSWAGGNAVNWTKASIEDWEDTTTPYGGTGSSLLIISSSANNFMYQALTSYYSPLDSFLVSFAYKNGFTGDIARYSIYDATNGAYIRSTISLESSTSWTTFSARFKVPAGCASFLIQLRTLASGDSVWFDNINVQIIGQEYYISDDGLDTNNGLSITTPWLTLSMINDTVFYHGDIIYLKTDGLWRETLTVPTSGSDGSPITFTKYDSTGESGAKPIIRTD